MLLDLRPSHPEQENKGNLPWKKQMLRLTVTPFLERHESIPNKWIADRDTGVTSRGMMEDSMVEIADIITAVLQDIENESALLDAQQKALPSCQISPTLLKIVLLTF